MNTEDNRHANSLMAGVIGLAWLLYLFTFSFPPPTEAFLSWISRAVATLIALAGLGLMLSKRSGWQRCIALAAALLLIVYGLRFVSLVDTASELSIARGTRSSLGDVANLYGVIWTRVVQQGALQAAKFAYYEWLMPLMQIAILGWLVATKPR